MFWRIAAFTRKISCIPNGQMTRLDVGDDHE
jgi:hypothetical protein